VKNLDNIIHPRRRGQKKYSSLLAQTRSSGADDTEALMTTINEAMA